MPLVSDHLKSKEVSYLTHFFYWEKTMQSEAQEIIYKNMKYLNPADMAFDERGRLIIRREIFNPIEVIHLQNEAIDRDRRLLENKLINPEDRIVRKSLEVWIEKIQSDLRNIKLNDLNEIQAARLAEIYNQSALIMFFVGRIDLAKDLCYAQMQFFQNLSHIHPYSIKHIAQPWINLSRIDRYEGNESDSVEKINHLYRAIHFQHESRVDASLFYRAINACPETKRVVNFCHIVEPIKTYLYSEQYDSIIDLYSVENESSIVNAFIYEAKSIAYANAGRLQEALMQLTYAKSRANPVRLHVFALRECEFHISRNQYCQIEIQLKAIKSYISELLDTKFTNLNDIVFAFHVCQVFKAANEMTEAIALAEKCYKVACQIEDECLQAAILCFLHECGSVSINAVKLIDLAYDLFSISCYQSVVSSLSSTFSIELERDQTSKLLCVNELHQQLSFISSHSPLPR